MSCGRKSLKMKLILVAKKKLEMEKTAVSSTTKLPKLKITPFKGTAGDWNRFENMFLTEADAKSISDEEKFGYLLESVIPKVRDRIANLRPGTVSYKTAWDRLKKEYGQTKVVMNAHMEEIINLFLSRDPIISGCKNSTRNWVGIMTRFKPSKL